MKKEPNKAPEPTTMAVTIRAPSRTARASHGRGSSWTLGVSAPMRQFMSGVIPRKRQKCEFGVWSRSVKGSLPTAASRCSDARIGVRVRTVWPGAASERGWFVGTVEAVGDLVVAEVVRWLALLLRMFDPPNKTPEPTPTSVTPRAFESVVELKQMNPDRFEARGAPAAVVAHLWR